MIYLVTTIHVIACFFIVIVILLQSGKGGDVAAAFGGMGSQTAFGPRSSANVLTKATTWSAVIFMVTSVTLSVMMSKRSSGSVLQGLKPAQTKTLPEQLAVPKNGSQAKPQPTTK